MNTKQEFPTNANIMKTRLLAFMLFLLIVPFGYSQRIQVEDGDTVAVVPIEQIRTANVIFVQKDSLQAELLEAKTLLTGQIEVISMYKDLDQQRQATNLEQKERISTFQSTINEKDSEIKTEKIRSALIAAVSGALLLLSIIF